MKYALRPQILGILVAALTLLTGCEFNIELNKPGIGAIVTCARLDDNMQCVDGTETTTFDGYAPMNASAKATVLAGDMIEISWTTGEREIERVSIEIEADGAYPVGAWAIPDPVLPNGAYTVTYRLNDAVAQEAVVKISGVTPEVVGVTACESEPVDSKCTPRAEPFDGTQTLHFLIEVMGADESDLLNAQVTQGEKQVAAVDIPLARESTLSVPFQVRPTPVLLTGDYQLSLSLNDQPAMTTPVAVIGPAPQVVDVITCSEIDEFQACVQMQEIFHGATPIYASAQVVGMTLDDAITARWLLGEQEVGSFSYPIDRPGNGSVSFNISPRSPLPVGDYLVEILYQGNVEAAVPFYVSRLAGQDVTPVRATATCRAISSDYECVEATETYAPTDTFYLWLQLVNLQAGETLTARWIGDDGAVIKEIPFTFDQAYTGNVYFDLIPDRPFPPGVYGVELRYGDLLVDRRDFSIVAE